MGLGGWLQDLLPESGTNTTQVRPVNEGSAVTIVPQQKSQDSFWGFLDDLGTNIQNGVSDIAKSKVQAEINRITLGSEASPDTTGDPTDQVGQNSNVQAPETFVDKYKTQMLMAVGVLAGLLVVKKLL